MTSKGTGKGQRDPLEVFYEKKLFVKIVQYSKENTCFPVNIV